MIWHHWTSLMTPHAPSTTQPSCFNRFAPSGSKKWQPDWWHKPIEGDRAPLGPLLLGDPMNSIMCSDCVAGMAALPSDSIPLTVTSPPYDQLRTFSKWDFE